MEKQEVTVNNQSLAINNQLKTGTKEWAETNVNLQAGCEHGCRYCYARYNAVQRFKSCTAEQWANPAINRAKVAAGYGKRSGRVMFPSSHDITQRNLGECLIVLKKLLAAGNDVLIVSKPHIECIKVICGSLAAYREQITFRFSIGSTNDSILSFWEPNAPQFAERLSCLQHAYQAGFKTSVSCEPYLDPHVVYTYSATKEFITDSFWIGMMNSISSRVDIGDMTATDYVRHIEPLVNIVQEPVVRGIYKLLKDQPFVRFKKTVREILNIKESEELSEIRGQKSEVRNESEE